MVNSVEKCYNLEAKGDDYDEKSVKSSYKDNKMKTLSQNGNYYYIDSKIEARKVLVEEMGSTLLTVAKDVKIQVEFNPSFIQGYRLIGFENRMLQSQDFTDDTKDAGEIGAGHEVIALYELVTVDSEHEVDGVKLKYQEQVNVDSDELLSVSVRYKNPDEDESNQNLTRCHNCVTIKNRNGATNTSNILECLLVDYMVRPEN